jgi:hypothetical protein
MGFMWRKRENPTIPFEMGKIWLETGTGICMKG